MQQRTVREKRDLSHAFDLSFEDPVHKKSKVELITHVSGSKVQSLEEQEETGPLVIPLIKRNQWHGMPKTESSTVSAQEESRNKSDLNGFEKTEVMDANMTDASGNWGLQVRKRTVQKASGRELVMEDLPAMKAETTVQLTLEDQAIAALLSDADAKAEKDDRVQIDALPILVQNSVPGLEDLETEDEKFKHDVSMRPDVASLEDYEKVPIEAFGTALLRGMGWKEGQSVGKNQSGILEPIMHKSRPHLLGLGATPAPPVITKTKKYVKPGEKREPDPFKVPPPPKEAPRKRSVSPVAKKSGIIAGDLVKILHGRHRGQVGKVVEIKQKSSGLAAKVNLQNSQEVARVWLDEVQLHDANGEEQHRSSSAKGWLRPRIRVRIISKSLSDGRYYNHKCVVQDVVAFGECILKTSNGELVDGVKERQLETYIPSVGATVMIVMNKDKSLIGHIGKLLEKNKSDETVIVQMEQSYDFLTFKYDEVAEFIE